MARTQTIPREEMLALQLEMLMQNVRYALPAIHLVAALIATYIFWYDVSAGVTVAWLGGLVLLLWWSVWTMGSGLANQGYSTRSERLFWTLLANVGLTGAWWSVTFVYLSELEPAVAQYLLLTLIVLLVGFAMGTAVVVREYFLLFMVAALVPIAWWKLVHYWQQPFNAPVGLFLLLVCAILAPLANRVHASYREIILVGWEREAMSRELGDLAQSLRSRNRELREMRQKLTELANLDELTGLANRRSLNTALAAEINRARRSGSSLGVILLDVDYFKHFNDTYGHPAGDKVLRQVGQLMRRAASRSGELSGRFGGEEFMIILPGANEQQARDVAQRLRGHVARAAIPHQSSKLGDVLTISQGVVSAAPPELDRMTPEDFIRRADDALYAAKNAGRDTIVSG